MVSVQHFFKIYKSEPAVSDFSMECKAGEIVGILGPNGAGKTTLLKAICARHFATRGKILLNGIDASEEPEKVRAMTGFVTEQASFPEELKVCEYLKMIFEIHEEFKKSEKKDLDSLESIKKQISLESIWNEKTKNLSKGFRERVKFSQALNHNPMVIVLDEPASGLDPAQIVRMRKTVTELRKNHAIILSTHLMQEVDALCDKVYILNKGRCVASGTQEEITDSIGCASLEEAFFKLTSS